MKIKLTKISEMHSEQCLVGNSEQSIYTTWTKKGYKINHQDEYNWQSPANWGKKTNTGHKLLIRDRRWDITTYPIVIKG